MRKPIAVTKLKVTQFSDIKVLAEHIYISLNLNPNFVNPQPSLPMLLSGIAELKIALQRWGEKGNRGSHQHHIDLEVAAQRLHKILTQLAAWCMSALSTDLNYAEQTVILASSGFSLKSDGGPQGKLEMVQNLHLFIARNIPYAYIKLRWKRPLNVRSKGNVKGYIIYRSHTNEFSTAHVAGAVTQTMFMEAPGIGEWFYWVVAVNNMGPGAVDSPIIVNVYQQRED